MFDVSKSLRLLPEGQVPRLLPAETVSVNTQSHHPAAHGNCTCRLLTVQDKVCAGCRLQTGIEYLIRVNKLTAASLNRLLIALKIPPEISGLNTKQARRLRHLLDHLVVHSPLTTKTDLSEADWRNWLAEHLPVPLHSCLRIADAGKPLPLKMPQETKKEIKKQTPKKKQRRKISPELYLRTAARQGSYCFWCGIPVMREQQIPTANRLNKTEFTVVYLLPDGGVREQPIGTVDHLVRVTDGGDNAPENLVISCLNCNLERERVTARYGRPFARRKFVCRECGGRFFHNGWGCCSVCGGRNEKVTGKLNAFLRGVAALFGGLISKRDQRADKP